MALLISNIGTLLTMSGDALSPLGCKHNTALICIGENIAWFGPEKDLPKLAQEFEYLDAQGCVVTPGFVDCHTHLVFAGDRSHECAMRAKGASYQDILRSGGGILHTTQATRKASESELVSLALPRLDRMLSLGVTTVEAKSGYGLNVSAELKMLEVMRTLSAKQAVEIVPTFLGAHAVPPEFEGNRSAYCDLIIEEMLPNITADGLAKSCDIFIEKGAFGVQDGRAILEKSLGCGLEVKVHAEQLSRQGGASLAAELFALSASHLEYINNGDINKLAASNVVAEILPLAQTYLGSSKWTNGRKLIDAGVQVAVATDFNPGSAHWNDLQMAARLSTQQCGLNLEEALLAITKHAAKALGRSDIGEIAKNKKADLCIWDQKNLENFFYDWSHNPIKSVIKSGKAVYHSQIGFLGSKPKNL